MEISIIALPLIASIISGFFGKLIGDRNSEIVTSLLVSISAILSAFVFYINHFADLLAKNQKLPVELSIWTPHLLMLIIVCIGLVRINEK